MSCWQTPGRPFHLRGESSPPGRPRGGSLGPGTAYLTCAIQDDGCRAGLPHSHGGEGDHGHEPGTYLTLEFLLSLPKNVPRLWPDSGRSELFHAWCICDTSQMTPWHLEMSDYIPKLNVRRKTTSDHWTELFPHSNTELPVQCPLFPPSLYPRITACCLCISS